MNKYFLLLLIVLTLPFHSFAATDWQVDIFDQSQALLKGLVTDEEKFMVGINPKVQTFFDVYVPFYESTQKMDRYVFLMQLKEHSEKIDWNSPYSWGSLSTAEQENLAEHDQNFKDLYQTFLGLREVLRGAKEFTHLRNRIFEEHKAEIIKKEQRVHEKLMVLRDTALKSMANQKINADGK